MHVEVRVYVLYYIIVHSFIASAKFYSAETLLNGLEYRSAAGNNVPEGIHPETDNSSMVYDPNSVQNF